MGERNSGGFTISIDGGFKKADASLIAAVTETSAAHAAGGHGEQIKPAKPPVDATVPAGEAEPELHQSEEQCESRAYEVRQENQPTLPQMFSVQQRVVAQELHGRAAQQPGDQARE